MDCVFKGDIYKKHYFRCPCSMTHRFPIGETVIDNGALASLPAVAERLNLGRHVLVVTDSVVLDIMGKSAMEMWREGGLHVSGYVLQSPLIPDERALGSVLIATDESVDFLVALGGGSVTDVVRYVATRLGRPYIPIPSAITMDGFFTDIALLIIGGMKTTIKTHPPASVIVDMRFIAQAPIRMNASGLGEMASKISSIADWYAASLVNGELYCDEVERLMCQAIGQAFGASSGIAKRDMLALKNLADALYKSAITMYWYGSARPAAGAEHHLTHYWVMRHNARGLAPGMHGQEVGVGAVLILDLWERMLAINETTFDIEAALASMPTREQWIQTVEEAYGEAASEVFKAQQEKTFDKGVRKKEIQAILTALPLLRRKFAEFLPSYKQLARQLKEAGAPYVPVQLNVTREELIDSVLYAKEVRNKYTSLWIADALGLLPEMAEALANDAEALAAELTDA